MKKLMGVVLVIAGICFTYYTDYSNSLEIQEKESEISQTVISSEEYTGDIFTVVNDNIPYFTEEDLASEPFEFYNELDELGRAQSAVAMIDKSLMPTEERGSIGSVKPTGWHTIKYDIVSGGYLYNRSHLIGHQLTGEDANKENLITGTRYFNVEGMLPFENMVADYITETGNKVLYRVTPVYEEENLLASGVIIEAKSVEDDDIMFNVFIHNIQPGIKIDYKTGTSELE